MLLGEVAFFFASERFLVLGRVEALGPPITVLTKIWNSVISRPKSAISRPKSVKTNQVGRHSLAAKTPTMKRGYFLEQSKKYPKQQKQVLFDNFAQPEVLGMFWNWHFFRLAMSHPYNIQQLCMWSIALRGNSHLVFQVQQTCTFFSVSLPQMGH